MQKPAPTSTGARRGLQLPNCPQGRVWAEPGSRKVPQSHSARPQVLLPDSFHQKRNKLLGFHPLSFLACVARPNSMQYKINQRRYSLKKAVLKKELNKKHSKTLASIYLFMCVCTCVWARVCVGTCMYVYMRKSKHNFQELIGSFFPPCEPQRVSSGHQALWQAPLPTEPSCQPQCHI